MPTRIQMPKLGLTMTEGTITEWVAAAGQTVAAGDVVMTIETDKVEAEVEAVADGIVFHTAAVGDTLEPGDGVGWLLAEGEAPPDGAPAVPPADDDAAEAETAPAAAPAETTAPAAPAPGPQAAGGRVVASPNAKRVAGELGVDLASVTGTGPGGRITSEDVVAAAPSRGLGGRLLSSPNARRVAAELGVDITDIAGTGPGGRITSEDVRAHAADAVGAPRPAAAAPAPAAPTRETSGGPLAPFAATKAAERLGVDLREVSGTGPGGRILRRDVYAHARTHGSTRSAAAPAPAASGPQPGDTIAMTGMRGIIAERMYSSLQTMAQLTLAMDVDMDRAVELRTQLKEMGADELGAVPGYTDMVIAAVARALRDHPVVNSAVVDDEIRLLADINVGMAVAVPDGLVVPVVHGADALALTDLAIETSRLAAAARDKKLSLDEMEGGTFSVTALGMFGVDMFTPVINPPNAGILGVGRIRDDVAWDGDRPRRVQRMTLSLTWDHRVVDGAPAAEFTRSVARYLEQPLRLLA